MKNLFIPLIIFVTFSISCNLFTLVGAQTEADASFFNSGGTDSPVPTSSFVSDMMNTCNNGITLTIRGGYFSNVTKIEIIDVNNSGQVLLTFTPDQFSNYTEYNIQLALPANFNTTSSMGIHAVLFSKNGGSIISQNLGCMV